MCVAAGGEQRAVVLYRAAQRMAAELRTAWASGRRVALSIEGGERVEGHVERIAATAAWVRVAGLHVPLDRVLALHRPSRLGDSTVRRRQRFDHAGRAQLAPQDARLWDGAP